jgi:DNA-binding transcriptional regulator YiaG
MKPTVASRLKQRMAEFTRVLESGDPIEDSFTCRKVKLDLKAMPYTAEAVKHTRKLLDASQSVFSVFLGVSVKTLQAWEQGTQPPNKMACRFMDEIQREPEYWIERLKGAVVRTMKAASKTA